MLLVVIDFYERIALHAGMDMKKLDIMSIAIDCIGSRDGRQKEIAVERMTGIKKFLKSFKKEE